MKKRTVVIMAACMTAIFTTLTGCGKISLTEDQKEAISETREELEASLKDSVSTAVEEISAAAETISEHTSGAEDHIKDVRDEIMSAAEDGSAMSGQELMEKATEGVSGEAGILISPEDIGLTDTDGNGQSYTFQYDGETFSAAYTPDKWKIYDSYKITNEADITIICQALIEEHQIHGVDMVSYRTPEDMAYEWLQHNIAYALLSDDSSFKSHAKDVDLNPEDQGKSFEDFYKDRTGKELTVEDIMKQLGN